MKNIVKTEQGVDLILIEEKEKLDELAELTAKMDRIRFMSKTGHADFLVEARWTMEEAAATNTGILFKDKDFADLTLAEYTGFYITKDWPVVKRLVDWNVGTAFEKMQRRSAKAATVLGLITVPNFHPNHYFKAGRSLERMWLAANADNIAVHTLSLSTLVFNTLAHGPKDALSPTLRAEALTLMERFEKIFAIDSKVGKVLLIRFFVDDLPEYRSMRMPIKDVLSF